jgi:superfamily II DNA or RNA helicase
MQLGPVRFIARSAKENNGSAFSRTVVTRETTFRLAPVDMSLTIQEIYAALAADASRNDLIFDDVLCALEAKRSPLLLTERRDHLEHFAQRLKSFTRNLIVLHGGMNSKERHTELERLAAIPENDERLILSTGRYIGEGFDDARLDTLFLALPISWKGTLAQYAGRLNRMHASKTEVRIYDYVDRNVPMLMKMFARRQRGYCSLGYTLDLARDLAIRKS